MHLQLTSISVLLCDSALALCAQIRAMRTSWPETFCQTQVSHISGLILIDVTGSQCSVTHRRGPGSAVSSPLRSATAPETRLHAVFLKNIKSAISI